jgi:hypothetical protein
MAGFGRPGEFGEACEGHSIISGKSLRKIKYRSQ